MRARSTVPPFPEHLRHLVRSGPANPNMVVTVIGGPSGSGKTTIVNDLKAWGDLVVDVDALFVALSGQPWFDSPQNLLPYVLDARDAVINRLARGDKDCRAWVITANGNMREVVNLAARLRASITILAVDRSECIRRIYNDPLRQNRELYTNLVHDWWQKFEETRQALPPSATLLTNK